MTNLTTQIAQVISGEPCPSKASVRVAERVLRVMREPTDAMIEAAAETPGMKAASAAMSIHQARGYGFAAGSFDDGSPLHQAWRAMIDAASQP